MSDPTAHEALFLGTSKTDLQGMAISKTTDRSVIINMTPGNTPNGIGFQTWDGQTLKTLFILSSICNSTSTNAIQIDADGNFMQCNGTDWQKLAGATKTCPKGMTLVGNSSIKNNPSNFCIDSSNVPGLRVFAEAQRECFERGNGAHLCLPEEYDLACTYSILPTIISLPSKISTLWTSQSYSNLETSAGVDLISSSPQKMAFIKCQNFRAEYTTKVLSHRCCGKF